MTARRAGPSLTDFQNFPKSSAVGCRLRRLEVPEKIAPKLGFLLRQPQLNALGSLVVQYLLLTDHTQIAVEDTRLPVADLRGF